MNGAVFMKSLFQNSLRISLLVCLLAVSSSIVARAQDSRLQMGSLDHLASKASQTLDVNIDERLIRVTARLLSGQDSDEKKVKELIAGLKGVYVKRFEFEKEGQYGLADLETIRAQLRGPGWARTVNFTSKQEGSLEVYLMMMAGEEISGLAVLQTDDKEITVVNIVGPVDLAKLSQIQGHLGIPELGIEPGKTKTKN